MANDQSINVDVAVIGGGPAGSTLATLLRKYNPDLSVLVLEKEHFPREHVGESQLPAIGPVLEEMGVWDKVEAANFPIKIGATFSWGKDLDTWDLDFYPVEEFVDEPRPAKYAGQRRHTAFQVDREIYDTILLDHAASLGADVRQGVRVASIETEGDRVTGLTLDDGSTVTARHYVDASGAVGLLRKAMGLESWAPTELRNIAIWDYWQNAKWAVEIGVGGTRIQVRSLPYGWIWFIPLGPTRTSIGLVCPSSYYKESGLSTEELYLKSLEMQKEFNALVKDAEREGPVHSTKDWSHLTERLVGENWFIAGEAAGFADPILSAGLTLAHGSAREAAYSILELDRGELDPAWLRTRYDERNRRNIRQHIRFAQFWYSANGCFTDIKGICQSIAKEAGVKLSPAQAWRWLSQGGFATETVTHAAVGSFDVSTTRQLLAHFDNRGRKTDFAANGYNVFKLNLRNATETVIGHLVDGRIQQVQAYERGGHRLPRAGYYGLLLEVLGRTSELDQMWKMLEQAVSRSSTEAGRQMNLSQALQALDVLIEEHWVTPSVDKRKGVLKVDNEGSRYVRSSAEAMRSLAEKGKTSHVKSNI